MTRRGQFLVDLVYLLTWVGLAAGAVWLLWRWLMPFLLAFATAAALQRPVRWLTTKTEASRGFLSGLLVVGLVLAVAAAAGGAGWWLWRAAVNFLGDPGAVESLADRLTGLWDSLQAWLAGLLSRFSPETRSALQASFGALFTGDGGLLGEWVAGAARGALHFVASSLPGALFAFLIWVMAAVFLTVDYRRVVDFLWRQLPSRRRQMVAEVCALCRGTLWQMAKAYFLLMLLTFGELAVGLWLLRVPGALALAALIALVDILPVLGVGTVLLPWAGVAFLNGDATLGVWLLVLYVVITVVRNLLEPRLVAQQVGLPPVVTLLCLYLGWQVAGVAGILLLPVAVTLLVQLQKRGHVKLWK